MLNAQDCIIKTSFEAEDNFPGKGENKKKYDFTSPVIDKNGNKWSAAGNLQIWCFTSGKYRRTPKSGINNVWLKCGSSLTIEPKNPLQKKVLSFYAIRVSATGDPFTVKVETSENNINWETEYSEVYQTAPASWRKIEIPLNKTGKRNIRISCIDGNTGDKGWLIDDIDFTEPPKPPKPRPAKSANTPLLPYPQNVDWLEQDFQLFTNCRLLFKSSDKKKIEKEIDKYKNTLETFGCKVQIKETDNNNLISNEIGIFLVEDIAGAKINKEEAYTIDISNFKIKITAVRTEGLYRALSTLEQLVYRKKDKKYFSSCKITDYPAFKIRGIMHDVGRSYISVEELKKEIDVLSKYKVNVFHWHFTENQAYRLESKLYPQLNEAKNMERHEGKFYTQEEVKDLVEFCKERHVLVIPEIDVPGHSEAFTRTFGFDMQSAQGKPIVKKLIDEACKLFDVPYMHIGTDEVHITDPNFVSEVMQVVRDNGMKVIGWKPGHGLDNNAIRQLWAKDAPSATQANIDSRYRYLNHTDPFADLFSIYNINMCDVDFGDDKQLGSIIAIWNDRLLKTEREIILLNALYPQMLALAERNWRGGGRSMQEVGVKMGLPKDKYFEEFRDFESRMLKHKERNFSNLDFPYVKQTNILWRITDAFPNKGDLTKVFPPENKIAENYTYDNKTYNTRKAAGATVYLRHVWGPGTVPAFYDNPKTNTTAYAYTYVYSEKARDLGLWVSFHNYGRSETDASPPQGKWGYKESKIWINDNEILPPKWETPGLKPNNKEVPYSNESFEIREPISVHLNKGWNKVLLKLPNSGFSSGYSRLVKWMFTAVFVEKNGLNVKEAEGLFYSPDKKLPELKADFKTNTQKLRTGDRIQFFDKTKNNPTKWLWTINGAEPNISNEKSPIVSFSKAGIYEVTLIATNPFSRSTVTKKITVSDKKSIDFNCPETAYIGDKIIFTDISSNNSTSWTWYFSDGEISHKKFLIYTFTKKGKQKIELTAIGDYADMLTKEIIIKPLPKPKGIHAEIDTDKNKLVIRWDKQDNLNFKGYNIYKNGELITNTTDNYYYPEDLNETSIYTFVISAKDIEDEDGEKGTIIFSKQKITKIEETQKFFNKIWIIGNTLNVEINETDSNLLVTNMSGQIVDKRKMSGTIYRKQLPKGVFVVTVERNDGKESRKVLIE